MNTAELGVLLPAVETYLFPGQVVGGLRTVAQFGLVLFMFLVGLEMDLGELRGSGRTVTVVAQASIAVPMVLAIGTAVLIYPRFGGGVSPVAFSLFFGAAMAVTAFPVLARLLLESGLAKRRVGVISLACAAINDLVAWVLVAVVVAVSGASGPGPVLLTLGLTVVFVAGMLLVVRPLLRRWGEPPVWAVLCLTLLAAWVAEQIGVHAIIGSFLAGLASSSTRSARCATSASWVWSRWASRTRTPSSATTRRSRRCGLSRRWNGSMPPCSEAAVR